MNAPPKNGSLSNEAAPIAPMSAAAAAGWTFLITLVFLLLREVAVALREASGNDIVTGFGCQLVAYLLGLFGILRVYAPERSIRDFLGFRRTSSFVYLLALLFGAAMVTPASAIYEAIIARYPSISPDTLPDVFQAASMGRRIAIGLVLAGFGPVIEEVLFRGAILRPLKRKIGALSGAVLTGVLFALVHMEWQVFPPFIVLGISLALLRLWSGSIVPGILVHAIFNGAALIELVGSTRGAQPVSVPGWVTLASAGLAFVLLALARVVSMRSRLAARAREADL